MLAWRNHFALNKSLPDPTEPWCIQLSLRPTSFNIVHNLKLR